MFLWNFLIKKMCRKDLSISLRIAERVIHPLGSQAKVELQGRGKAEGTTKGYRQRETGRADKVKEEKGMAEIYHTKN